MVIYNYVQVIPYAGMLFYFHSVDFNRGLFLEPCKETGRKECPPLVEFAELGKRGQEGIGTLERFGKGENTGSVILRKE